MKDYKKSDYRYFEAEWENDKEWIAQRIAFLWGLREKYPRHYCDNGFGHEKSELYEWYGSDNWIMSRAQEIFYVPQRAVH